MMCIVMNLPILRERHAECPPARLVDIEAARVAAEKNKAIDDAKAIEAERAKVAAQAKADARIAAEKASAADEKKIRDDKPAGQLAALNPDTAGQCLWCKQTRSISVGSKP